MCICCSILRFSCVVACNNQACYTTACCITESALQVSHFLRASPTSHTWLLVPCGKRCLRCKLCFLHDHYAHECCKVSHCFVSLCAMPLVRGKTQVGLLLQQPHKNETCSLCATGVLQWRQPAAGNNTRTVGSIN